MKTINLVPGSSEWMKSRSASKAPAMMDDSIYQSRNELLFQMHSGITKEVDAATQARFDNGHRTEALSRKLAEEIIGEELAPISAASDDDYLTANFDGITFLSNIGYEHKDWNEKLATYIRSGVVPNSHAWQLDQQILVGDLEYVLFVVSDGTKERFVSHKYYPDKGRMNLLLAGWRKFDEDLAVFVPPEIIPEVVAAPIKDLPALSVQATGMVTHSNLTEFKAAAESYIANINTKLETDQQFSDAEATVKFCKTTEETLEVTKKTILAQTATIDEVIRTVYHIQAQLRDKRLMLDKLVKTEKDARKLAILTGARDAFVKHVAGLAVEIKPIQLPVIVPDFAGAIKGMKKLAAMQEAVDNALRDGKMVADMAAQDIRAKQAWFFKNDNDPSNTSWMFLFSDLQQIITKPMDDFKLLVTTRIDKHKADEAAKIERIREEERVKAEAAAKAKVEAEAKVEQDAKVASVAAGQIEVVAQEAPALSKEPAGAANMPGGSSATGTKGIVPTVRAAQPASRPTRMQIIEAVAQHFGMTVLAADELLRSEFDPKAYAGDQEAQAAV